MPQYRYWIGGAPRRQFNSDDDDGLLKNTLASSSAAATLSSNQPLVPLPDQDDKSLSTPVQFCNYPLIVNLWSAVRTHQTQTQVCG